MNTFSIPAITDAWQNRLGIDVDVVDVFKGLAELVEYECVQCGLRFFPPEFAGSEEMYAQLEHCDWYYMPRKWEHDVAIDQVGAGQRVLEVGCGSGHFVERLVKENGCDAVGIELNRQAADLGRAEGRPVLCCTLREMAETQAASFDIVCSFQVVEHVGEVAAFLSDSISLLKPHGRMLIGVPNSSGFIRLEPMDLLNLPPHHISRWSPNVIRSVGRLFPLRLQRLRYEPLAEYHFDWFVRLQLRKLKRTPRIRFTRRIRRGLLRVVESGVFPILRWTRCYRLFRGHTLYACFEKNDTSEWRD